MNSIGFIDKETNSVSAGKDLLINANLPPMGVNLYYVSAKDTQDFHLAEDVKEENLTFGTEVSNYFLSNFYNYSNNLKK